MKLDVVNIAGMEELNKLLAVIPKKAKSAVVKTLKKDLMDLKRKSAEKAPKLSGDLERSADSDAGETFFGVSGYVSFNMSYATIQHENMDFHHDDPVRGAKYLEGPLMQNVDLYITNIAEAIRKASGD